MMDAKTIALVIQSCICVALIIFVLFKFWSEARLDAFRQKVFALRDELFDFAADGHISFDDPAYRLLRQSMNGKIRYAHQLTFFRVNMTMIQVNLATHTPKVTWSEDWQKALERLRDDDVRRKLEAFHDRAMLLVVDRLVLGSPVLLGLVICSVPFLMLRMGWLNLKAIVKKAPLFTVSHVFDTQMIENEAAAAAIA
jgi:hypothetical protein